MLTHILYAALAPVLIAQAIYVRRKTPRLAEASGPRSGSLGHGEPLKLMILGDSAAAGVGVQTQSQALAGQLTELLSQQMTVNWQLQARNGKTSGDLLKEITLYPKQAIDWVILSIGVNDVTGLTPRQQWNHHVRSIAHQLKSRFNNPHIIWTQLPPMHLFPALPQPLRFCLGRRAKQLNRDLMTLTESLDKNHLLTLNTPLEDDFMADDGFHPSAKMYRLWAQATFQKMQRIQPFADDQ